MIISVNWLKKFTDITLPIDELATLIGARLVEIESVTSLAEKYKDVVVVKVVECEPIQDSDHLNLTKVDDGGVVDGVERDENGYVQVVCGAPNVTAGMMAAWLPPKSIVPETYGSSEPFILGARALRGHTSNGMLASAKELDLFDDHSGIIAVDKDAAPGTSFAELYELNDHLLDIENKSLTHRPDAFGVIGFAREVAGIQGVPFKSPDWLGNLDVSVESDSSVTAPTVIIDEPELSDRFSVVVLADADETALSPLEMQTYLARSGVRPISAIVDVTNYLMLLTGQPMHAYDYDKFLKVSGDVNEIHVRSARENETLALLDGRNLELSPDDMVIAAGDVAVGLAGAMGGADTEIDSSTKRILLECATFNLYKLRAIQMRHGVFTEAITRLTKGVPAPLGRPVIAEAVLMLQALAGAQPVSDVAEDYPGKKELETVTVQVDHVNEVLGTDVSAGEMVQTLATVECSTTEANGELVVAVPYWRHDLVIPEDIIEEIGRLRGFDSITQTLPRRDFTAVSPSQFDQLRASLRRILVRSGANEVLTYSFVHGDLMRKVGQNPDEAYRIVNSISPDLQYYRQSLVPSLLSAVHPNVKAGYDAFALFELNKFHTKRHGNTDEDVPKELDGLGFVITDAKKTDGDAFYDAKQYLEYVGKVLGITFLYEPLESDSDYPVTQPFEPRRSARVWNADKTVRVGVVGELKRSVQKAFKLPTYTAGFEISPRGLEQMVTEAGASYSPLSRYPTVTRDVSFQTDAQTSYATLYQAVVDALPKDESINVTVTPLDIYQAESSATKNTTLRLIFSPNDRTLTGDEVTAMMQAMTEQVTTAIDGKVV